MNQTLHDATRFGVRPIASPFGPLDPLLPLDENPLLPDIKVGNFGRYSYLGGIAELFGELNRQKENFANSKPRQSPAVPIPSGPLLSNSMPNSGIANASSSGPTVQEAMKAFQAVENDRPGPPEVADLKGPSTLQLVAGGLGALLMPRMAAAALASPFQAALGRQARETAENEVRAQAADQVWQGKRGDAETTLNLALRQEGLRPSSPDAAPPAANPGRGTRQQNVARRLKAGDRKGAFQTTLDASHALRKRRGDWFGPEYARTLDHGDDVATNARHRAEAGFDALSRQPVRSPQAIKALGRQQGEAQRAVEASIRTLVLQRQAILRRLDATPSGPEAAALTDLLDLVNAAEFEQFAYLQRLDEQKETIGQWRAPATGASRP